VQGDGYHEYRPYSTDIAERYVADEATLQWVCRNYGITDSELQVVERELSGFLMASSDGCPLIYDHPLIRKIFDR